MFCLACHRDSSKPGFRDIEAFLGTISTAPNENACEEGRSCEPLGDTSDSNLTRIQLRIPHYRPHLQHCQRTQGTPRMRNLTIPPQLDHLRITRIIAPKSDYAPLLNQTERPSRRSMCLLRTSALSWH